MSGTDAPSFPPSGSKFPEAPRRFPESSVRAVEIITLPPALRGHDAPLNVAGKILESRREDGTIRIHTDYGDVTVRTKDRAPPPEAGRVVEIEIPPREAATPDRAVLRSETTPAPRKDFYSMENKSVPEQPSPSPSHFETHSRNIDIASQNETLPSEINFRNTEIASQNGTSHFETSAQNFAQPAVRFIPLTPAQLSEILTSIPLIPESAATLASFWDTVPPPLLNLETTGPDRVSADILPVNNLVLFRDIDTLYSFNTSGKPFPDIAFPAPLFRIERDPFAHILSLFGQTADSHQKTSIDSRSFQNTALLPLSQNQNALHEDTLSTDYNSSIFFLSGTNGTRALPISGEPHSAALNAIPIAFHAPQTPFFPSFSPEKIISNQYTDKNIPLIGTHTQAGFLTGTILTKTDGGLPVISIVLPDSSRETLFVMQAITPHGMPGTTVLLAPLATPVPTEIQFIYNALPDSFEELWQLMVRNAPHVLADGAARLLPSPAAPNALGPATLLFLAVLRSGDLAGWMGEKTTDALRRIGKSDLATRAARDLSALSTQAQESENGWKTIPLPMAWDGRIHRVSLHWREGNGNHDTENNEENKGKNGARFIFDLTFDRLGPVQLDGLMRGNRLDIALRTTVPLGAAMRQTLSLRYADSIALAGLGGELHFQTSAESWVRVRRSTPTRSSWA